MLFFVVSMKVDFFFYQIRINFRRKMILKQQEHTVVSKLMVDLLE